LRQIHCSRRASPQGAPPAPKALSSEVGAGSREEDASE
jgi:hypothetical protein